MTTITASPQLAPAIDALQFDCAVPRGLVHRAAVAEVFATDSLRVDESRFLVAAQLPRMHSFYNDSPVGHHDVLLLVEIARQAGVLIAHRYLGVPADRAFIFHTADITVDHPAATRMERSAPSRLVLQVSVVSREDRGGVPLRLGVDVAFMINDVHVAGGCGSFLFLRRRHYHGLREHARTRKGLPAAGAPAPAPASVGPGAVGRRDGRNVVISAPVGDPREDGGMACEVVVDQDHPVLFDHPLDHLPGVILLEAYRQTALLAAARAHGIEPERAVVGRCRATFAEFGEHELATHCTARVDAGSPGVVHLALHQGPHRLSEGRVDVIACP